MNNDNSSGRININHNAIEVRGNNEILPIDKFAENNITTRNIIDNALFLQLSEINIKLLNFDESLSERIYEKKGKILPKIDFIEFSLLNQNESII